MYVIFNGGNKRFTARKLFEIVHFRLQNAPPAFHRSIVKTSADTRHTLDHTRINKLLVKHLVGILKSSIAMEDWFCISTYKAIFLVTLYYGLRRSEILGLKWSAVDGQKNTITISHTVVKNLTIERKDTTKTATSNRTFQLLPEVKAILEQIPRNNEYIFPIRPDTLTRKFQKQLAKAGFEKMRFHDIRHSTASILFEIGWSLEDIKNWLGHADIETTSNIYLHYQARRKVLLADSLRGLLI